METPSHDSPYDAALDGAVRAARAAAVVIRNQAGPLNDVRAKGKNDFVTETDEKAQAAALETLREAFPEDPVLAEEGGEPDAIPAGVDGRRWIVDPLDGTTNLYIRCRPTP